MSESPQEEGVTYPLIEVGSTACEHDYWEIASSPDGSTYECQKCGAGYWAAIAPPPPIPYN